MPELPEVETTRRGIEPHILGRTIQHVVVREPRLRWRVPRDLDRALSGRRVTALDRRAKYLLLRVDAGTALIHLGMSGSLFLAGPDEDPGPYDHIDLVLKTGVRLRLRDPRRFGSVHWTRADPYRHPLLRNLGPEPLGETFSGDLLYQCARGRAAAIKAFLMDSRTVAGLGNIYVNEALFLAGIHPKRAAGRIGRPRYGVLADAIQRVLREAIAQGGTTLRDFRNAENRPGYFQLSLRVYQRTGAPCPQCGTPIRAIRHLQRRSFYCPRCQK